MAEPTLRARLSMTDAPFQATLRRATQSAIASGRRMGTALKNGISGGLGAAAVLTAGALIGGRAFAGGIKGALDLGGAMTDLRAQTGAAIGPLIVMRQALEDSGVSGDKLGGILNKMQRAIYDAADGSGPTAEALAGIGLSARDLLSLDPAGQFQAIGEAISAIEHPTQRSAAAMAIFGKSGGELGAVFSGFRGNIGTASKSLGKQAKLLEENADSFDKISDRLNRGGAKLRGFFVGAASVLVPALMAFTGAMENLDLAPIGEQFGALISDATSMLTGVFENPEILLGAFGNYLLMTVAQAGNSLAKGLIKAGLTIAEGLKLVNTYGNALDLTLTGAALSFGGQMVGAMSKAGAYMAAGLTYAFQKSVAILDSILRPVVQYVQAGLQVAVEGIMEGIGSIPIVGATMGLDGFKGATFDEALQERKKQGPPMLKEDSFESTLSKMMDNRAFKGAGADMSRQGAEISAKANVDGALDEFQDKANAIWEAKFVADIFGSRALRDKAHTAMDTLKALGKTTIRGQLNKDEKTQADAGVKYQGGLGASGGLGMSGGLGGSESALKWKNKPGLKWKNKPGIKWGSRGFASFKDFDAFKDSGKSGGLNRGAFGKISRGDSRRAKEEAKEKDKQTSLLQEIAKTNTDVANTTRQAWT